MTHDETSLETVSVGSALVLIGRSRRTLQRWVAAGTVTELRDSRGHRRYLREELVRFVPRVTRPARSADPTSSAAPAEDVRP
jgi:hypothetical protein